MPSVRPLLALLLFLPALGLAVACGGNGSDASALCSEFCSRCDSSGDCAGVCTDETSTDAACQAAIEDLLACADANLFTCNDGPGCNTEATAAGNACEFVSTTPGAL